jgi:hypothetical protein
MISPLVSKVKPFHLADFAESRSCGSIEGAPFGSLAAFFPSVHVANNDPKSWVRGEQCRVQLAALPFVHFLFCLQHSSGQTGLDPAARCPTFTLTSYLNPAHDPGVDRKQIVDYESHTGIVHDIPILLSFRKAPMATDFDGVFIRVVTETHRHPPSLIGPSADS